MIDYKNYMMEQPKKSIRHSLLAAGGLGLIIAMMVVSCVKGIDKTIELEERKNAPLRQERERIMRGDHLADAFQTAGSPDPHLMAKACRATKDPKLMAAVAIVESNGTPHAVGRSGERGAWQVIPKVWGNVPKSADGQARQAERILNELVVASPRGSLLQGLSAYNTGSYNSKVGRQYAMKVMEVRRSI